MNSGSGLFLGRVRGSDWVRGSQGDFNSVTNALLFKLGSGFTDVHFIIFLYFAYYKYCVILFKKENFKLGAKWGRCAFLGGCFIWAGKQSLAPTPLPSSCPLPAGYLPVRRSS